MDSSNVFINPEKGIGFVNSDKNFIAFVKDDGKKFKVAVVSVDAEIPISDDLTYDTGKDLIEAIPLFNRFKGVIFKICDSEDHGFSNNYVFCEAVKAELKKHNIKYMFTTSSHFLMSSLIIGANLPDITVGDTVFSCVVSSDNAVCTEFRFTKHGYALVNFKNYQINLRQSYSDIRDAILDSSEPTKIILSAAGPNDPMIKTFKNIFKSKNLVIIEHGLISATYKTVVELYKKMNGKHDVKKYLIPTSPREYRIGFIMGGKFYRGLSATCRDALPFSNTISVPRSALEWAMTYTHTETLEPVYLQRFNLPTNGHRCEITLSVDEEGIPSYEIEPHLLDDVKNIPEKLNRTGLKLPVISFFDNSTVISVYKEGNGYQFLDSWGGIYGNELFISFDKSKPTFCTDAAEALRTKPSFVVTDFTELMANVAERLTLEWPFKITRDAKNAVLIEFDNYDGTRKVATPVFLMALLLKQHIKVLKAEGLAEEELKNIGFHFVNFDRYRDGEKWNRLQKNMKQVCELLKINWNEDTKIII